MVSCRECGKEVSKNAKACPHCGEPSPSAASAGAKWFWFLLLFFFLFIAITK